jgi:hypothetical protein
LQTEGKTCCDDVANWIIAPNGAETEEERLMLFAIQAVAGRMHQRARSLNHT